MSCRPLLLTICTGILLSLGACTGAMVSNVMPGDVVTMGENTFTVRDNTRGLTVQNFETGRTNPAVLENNARAAAEQISGCPVDKIVKDGITNTWYITVNCAA